MASRKPSGREPSSSKCALNARPVSPGLSPSNRACQCAATLAALSFVLKHNPVCGPLPAPAPDLSGDVDSPPYGRGASANLGDPGAAAPAALGLAGA
eukprot:12192837-Karenia_brevis.AAC.1